VSRTFLRERGMGLRTALATLCLAAAVLCGSGCNNGPATGPSRPEMVTGMSRARTLQAVVLSSDHMPEGILTRRSRLRCTAAGDSRAEILILRTPKSSGVRAGDRELFVYDAERHEEMTVLQRSTEKPNASSSAPVWGESPLGCQGYATAVKAALAEGDPSVPVRETRYAGKPCWVASLLYRGYTVRVVVDKASGLSVSCTESEVSPEAPGRRTEERFVELRLDAVLPAGSFEVAPPAGMTLQSYKGARHYGSLVEADSRVGYHPYVPSWVPKGYRPAEVATAPLHSGPLIWVYHRVGVQPRPSPGQPDGEVDARYRRGFDWFSIRVARGYGSENGNGENAVESVQREGYAMERTLGGGAFEGYKAWTWFDARGADLLIVTDQFWVMISGCLSRDEIVGVAESLNSMGV